MCVCVCEREREREREKERERERERPLFGIFLTSLSPSHTHSLSFAHTLSQVKPHPMFIEESGKVMPSVTQLELMSIVVPGLSCYSK